MASPVLKTLSRVGITLKTYGNNLYKSASFLDCIVRYFEPSKHFVTVQYSLENNLLTLYGPIVENENRTLINPNEESCNSDIVILQHSPECPISNLTETDLDHIPQDITDGGVAIGVSIVLETADNRILMTRRANHLRTFPNAWVPPGGHIELNESLIEAGLRELEEETGLRLNESSASIKVLCLWESVYPLLLGLGLPRRHHIVVYLHAMVNRPWKEIHQEIKLDPSEVQACTWLTPEIVNKLLIGKKENLGSHEMFSIQDNGLMVSCALDLTSMFHHLLWKEGKVYSGSQLALNKWIEILSTRSVPTSKI